jgi:hypothetical protein
MIRNSQRLKTGRDRLLDKLGGTVGPVRFVGVRVKVDQKEMSPKLSSVAQTLSALCSGVSLEECTTISGLIGGS